MVVGVMSAVAVHMEVKERNIQTYHSKELILMDEYSCDGCCYKEWHNGDHSKCNFLIKHECLIYEKKENEE